jgi:hypothetical protein
MGSSESIPVELRHRVFNLVNSVRNNTGTARSDALREIWLLTENDDYKIPLCDPSLGFLALVTELLSTSHHDQITLKNAIACICNLSTHQANKLVICDPILGLIPALVNLIDESHGTIIQDISAKKWIYTTLSNCALNPLTHPYLLANSSVRYLEVLKTEMERDPTYLPPVKSFGCISLSLPNHLAHLIVNLRVHEIIVNRLMSFGPIPSAWPDRNTGMAYWSLNFVTAFSSLPEGRNALRKLHKPDFFFQLLSCTEMEGIKAGIITSNIFEYEGGENTNNRNNKNNNSNSLNNNSNEEDNSRSPIGNLNRIHTASTHTNITYNTSSSGNGSMYSGVSSSTMTNASNNSHSNSNSNSSNPSSNGSNNKSILETFPQIFPTLMDVYSATLDFDANRSEVKSLLSRGFGYAIVKMRDITATLRNLSMNNKNKRIMLQHPSLLPFVLKSIFLFIDNKLELNAVYHNYREYAGGGGKDFETIEYLLELFFYSFLFIIRMIKKLLNIF